MAATVALLDPGTSVRCRLARIEGQAAGLGRMWDAGRPPEEMLDQIAAVRAALRGVAVQIVHDSAERRLSAAPTATDLADPTELSDSVADVLALLDRLLRCP